MLRRTKADIQERLIFTEKPTLDEVRALAAKLPNGPRDIVSTRGRRYKELNLAEKNLTDDELIALLAEEPWLWRRPVVVRGNKVVVGYNAEQLEELLS